VLGRQLGHFRVDGPLGAGGMGEVYRARDLQLDREVAIKVLPAAVARDPDDPRLFSALGLALAGLGRREEALLPPACARPSWLSTPRGTR
jgi:serine/threonine protein kinase